MESIGSRFVMGYDARQEEEQEVEEFRALENYDQIPPAEQFREMKPADVAAFNDCREDMDPRDIPALDRAIAALAKGLDVVWTDYGPEDRCYFAVREVTIA